MKKEPDPVEIKLETLLFQGCKPEQPCPSDEQFAALMDGQLAPEEEDRLKTHLCACHTCHLALQVWKETEGIEGPPVPAHLLAAARLLVKPKKLKVVMQLLKNAVRLLNPADLSLAEPVLAGVCRGEGDSKTYETLEIKPDLPFVDSIRIQAIDKMAAVKISLLASSYRDNKESRGVRVDLYRDSELIQSWPLTPPDTSLNPVEQGHYRVELVATEPGSGTSRIRLLGSVEIDLTG